MLSYISNFVPTSLLTITITIQLLSTIVQQQSQLPDGSRSTPGGSLMISAVGAQVFDLETSSTQTQTQTETILPLIRLEQLNQNQQQSSHVEQTTYTKSDNFLKRTVSTENSGIVASTENSVKAIEEFLDKDYLANDFALDTSLYSNSILNDSIDNNQIADEQQQQQSYSSNLKFSNNYKKKLADYSNFNSKSNGQDWWTRLSSNQDHDTKTFSRKKNNNNNQHTKQYPQNKNVFVYKEQPLNQSIILTLKNQLVAIKSKHRLLTTKSVNQLQQLDNKLISSYKLCFKKNMPLYGGMLYRTRDFVIKMAKEVKLERKNLESMTKQVQKVLKERLANKTLVKEYERLINFPTTTISITTEQPTILSQQDQSTKILSTRYKKDSLSVLTRELSKIQAPSSFDNHLDDDQSQQQQQINIQTKKSSTIKQKTNQPRYTISINEVILKKELIKCQALIDRINISTYELSSVADDIIFLFRLSDSPQGRRGTQQGKMSSKKYSDSTGATNNIYMMMSNAEQRRAKKMLKSPIKLFFERYGKLTMDNNNNLITANGTLPDSNSNPQELRPIFEETDFGFDQTSTTTISTTDMI